MKMKFCYFLLLTILTIIGVYAMKPDRLLNVETSTGGLKKIDVLERDHIEEVLSGGNNWYVIRHNHNLKGGRVTIGDNSIVEFRGGSFTNGTIVGLNTEIVAPLYQIFDTSIRFEGTFKNNTIYPEWFGAVGNDKSFESKNTEAINAACIAAIGCSSNVTDISEALRSINSVTLSNKIYYVNGTINLPSAYFTIRSQCDAVTGYVNHGMATIKTSTKEPVFNLVDRRINDNYFNGGVEKLVIENIKIEGAGRGMTVFGIGKSDCEYVRDTKISNVLVQHCRYGIYFNMPLESHVRTFYAQNLSCRENGIGLYIKTAIGIDKRNKAWMNVNKFEDCYFTNNSIFGVIIEKMFNQSFNNVFEGCIIQDNGLEYTIDDYKKFGAGGVNLVCCSADFNNCYFEGNYARRTDNGKMTKEEVLFVSNYAGTKKTQIEPKLLGRNEGTIICSSNGLNYLNLNTCVVQLAHRLLSINSGTVKININGGTFNNPFPINNKTSKAIVDYIPNGNGVRTNFGDVRLICKNFSDLPSSSSYTDCVYRVNGSLGNAIQRNQIDNSYIDIDVKGKNGIINPIEYNNYGEFRDGVNFFIDPANGSDKNVGTSPNSALKTLSPLYRNNIKLPMNVNIIVIGDRSIEPSFNQANKKNQHFIISTYKNFLENNKAE